jgi:hypothetical protein
MANAGTALMIECVKLCTITDISVRADEARTKL